MDSLSCGKVDTFIYHFTDLYIYLFNTDDVHRLSVAAAAGKRYVLQTLGDEAVLVLGYSYFWTTQTYTIEHNVHFDYLIYVHHIFII